MKAPAARCIERGFAFADHDGNGRLSLAEVKQTAATAYDGINESLSELRMSIVIAQESYGKMERSIADREAAKRVREAIEQTMERADEAKGHIRSLRSILE